LQSQPFKYRFEYKLRRLYSLEFGGLPGESGARAYNGSFRQSCQWNPGAEPRVRRLSVQVKMSLQKIGYPDSQQSIIEW